MTAEVIEAMKENIRIFLSEHYARSSPLLVGFSGGSDSYALAHLLDDLKIPIHLAHFDHGWRAESRVEAERLALWARQKEIPFHTERWKVPNKTEIEARNERYQFFEGLFHKTNEFQALVLAHHADDQAETVLKRLLEGAHFHNFRAMQPISFRRKIPIWRPFLSIAKSDILLYVKEKGMLPIEDGSNCDPRYLRARMRGELLPHLSEHFGKNITPPLARLSHYGNQLSEYLLEKTKAITLQKGPKGPYYDFRGAHPVEMDFVLSRSPLPTPSHHSLKKIHYAVTEGKRNLSVSHAWLVDEGRVIWVNRDDKWDEILVN